MGWTYIILDTMLNELERIEAQANTLYRRDIKRAHASEKVNVFKVDISQVAEPELLAKARKTSKLTDIQLRQALSGEKPNSAATMWYAGFLFYCLQQGYLNDDLTELCLDLNKSLGFNAVEFYLVHMAWLQMKANPYSSDQEFWASLDLATQNYNHPEQWIKPEIGPSSVALLMGCLIGLHIGKVMGYSVTCHGVAEEHLTIKRHLVEGHILYVDNDLCLVYEKDSEIMVGVSCFEKKSFWATIPSIRREPIPLSSWRNLRKAVKRYRGKAIAGRLLRPESEKIANIIGLTKINSYLVKLQPQRKGFSQ